MSGLFSSPRPSTAGLFNTSRTNPSFSNFVNRTQTPNPRNQYMSSVPSSTISNSPSGTPSTPAPTTTAGGSARSQYVNSVSQGQFGTVRNINGGTVYSDPRDNPNFSGYQGGKSTPSAAPVTGATATSGSSNPADSSAYIKYLTGMFDPDKVSSAFDAKTAAAKRLSDVQDLEERTATNARKGVMSILDRSGGTVGGAHEAAGVYTRRSTDDLADLSLQESAAARSSQLANDTFDSYINAGKTVYEAEQAAKKAATEGGFSLNEGEKRFDANGKEIAYGGAKTYAPKDGLGTGTFTGTLSPLAQAVQNGTVTLDKLTPTQRGQVAAELASAGISSDRQTQLASNLSLVDDLLASNTDSITGVGQNPFNFLGLSNQKTINQYNQLKGILSLENRQQLKGQGAISDFEFKVLSDAASALGRNLNNADFREQLQKVRDVFAGKYAKTNATSGNSPAQTVQMTGPGGTFMVPISQVQLFKQNGYN